MHKRLSLASAVAAVVLATLAWPAGAHPHRPAHHGHPAPYPTHVPAYVDWNLCFGTHSRRGRHVARSRHLDFCLGSWARPVYAAYGSHRHHHRRGHGARCSHPHHWRR